MEALLLDTNETLPRIHPGDYEFEWCFGDVRITNAYGDVIFRSIAALEAIAASTGMSLAVRQMASAALEWVEVQS